MKLTAKHILSAWIATLAIFATCLRVLDHFEVTPSLFFIVATQTLSFFICISIARHESNGKNKAIFVNFAALFSVGFFGMIGLFVTPSLFPQFERAKQMYDTFVNYGLYALLLTFSVAYLTIDVLFRDFKIIAKYAVTIVVVGGLFYGYFHHYLDDPLYANKTQDVLDWKVLDNADAQFAEAKGRHATAEELAGLTDMYVYQDGQAVAVLNNDARLARIERLLPYLERDNYQTLMGRPIWLYVVKMSIACVGFILLFFGYLYMKDPPQGAYIEKIMFLLLIYCSMEVLHNWSNTKAVEMSTMSEILATGQYASNVALLLIALYLSLRLRFISSVRGEFYETELSERPTGVTRWRDTLDNMVVESFFNRHTLMGRLFAVPEHQRHPH